MSSVYAVGFGGFGSISKSCSNFEDFTLMKEYTKLRVKKIAPSLWHCLILTEEGTVYAVGRNRYGNLGLGNEELGNILEPTLIATFEHIRVVDIACSNQHSMVLTDDGRLFSFGFGAGRGLGNNELQGEPQVVSSLLTYTIVQISAGEYHGACVTSDGYAFVWGLYSRLPTKVKFAMDDQGVQSPSGDEQVESNVFVKKVCCGEKHTILLDKQGEIYGLGRNNFGQLSRLVSGNSVSHVAAKIHVFGKIQKIDKEEHIVDVECGIRYTMLLTSCGRVILFGTFEEGTNTPDGNVRLPTLLDLPSTIKIHNSNNKGSALNSGVEAIKSIHGGDSHFGILTERGVVYLWGNNIHYMCGVKHKVLPKPKKAKVEPPNPLHSTYLQYTVKKAPTKKEKIEAKHVIDKPRKVEELLPYHVRDIYLGGHNSFAITGETIEYDMGRLLNEQICSDLKITFSCKIDELDSFYKNEDVQQLEENPIICSHRAILASRSSYLHTLLKEHDKIENIKEGKYGINLDVVPLKLSSLFMNFIYKNIATSVPSITNIKIVYSEEDKANVKFEESDEPQQELFLQILEYYEIKGNKDLSNGILSSSSTEYVEEMRRLVNNKDYFPDVEFEVDVNIMHESEGEKEEDVTNNELNLGIESVFAHKGLLSVRSDYFLAMFTSGMEETKMKKIVFLETSKVVLENLLHFLYTGSFKESQSVLEEDGDVARVINEKLDPSIAVEMLELGCRINNNLIKTKAEHVIVDNIDLDNVITLFGVASFCSSDTIKHASMKFIAKFYDDIEANPELMIQFKEGLDEVEREQVFKLHERNIHQKEEEKKVFESEKKQFEEEEKFTRRVKEQLPGGNDLEGTKSEVEGRGKCLMM